MATRKKIEKAPSVVMSGIKSFLETCPALSIYLETLGKEVDISFLDEPTKSYSIDPEPNEPWIKKYADGTGVKLLTFTFSSREPYGKDVIDSLCSCGFFEKFSDWIEEKNRNKEFPDIGDKKKVQRMDVATTPYVFEATETTAKYQMSIQIRYYMEV